MSFTPIYNFTPSFSLKISSTNIQLITLCSVFPRKISIRSKLFKVLPSHWLTVLPLSWISCLLSCSSDWHLHCYVGIPLVHVVLFSWATCRHSFRKSPLSHLVLCSTRSFLLYVSTPGFHIFKEKILPWLRRLLQLLPGLSSLHKILLKKVSMGWVIYPWNYHAEVPSPSTSEYYRTFKEVIWVMRGNPANSIQLWIGNLDTGRCRGKKHVKTQ